MKYSLAILALLAMLTALPASPAWSETDNYAQCMESCMAPAIESGDQDAINAAVKKCLDQCAPEEGDLNNEVYATSSGNSGSTGKCLTDCSSKHRQCLRTERDPMKCQIQFENCRRKCYR
jgi:hypothetical protein